MRKDWKYIFFDADDTLWENEWNFRDGEKKFCALMTREAGRAGLKIASEEEIVDMLWHVQEVNIPLFGYGSKTYFLGMIETAMKILGQPLSVEIYEAIRKIILDIAFHDLDIYEGVRETLSALSKRYRLAVVTKGDLTEQTGKFDRSGLAEFFHHIDVVPNKSREDYLSLMRKLDVDAEDVLMVGNSVRSDIIPMLEIGASAIYIPSENIWIHEVADLPSSKRLIELSDITKMKEILL